MIWDMLMLSALQFRSFSAVAVRTRGYRQTSRGLSHRCYSLSPLARLRGGSQDDNYTESSIREISSSPRSGDQKYVKLSDPAPGSRKFIVTLFHI